MTGGGGGGINSAESRWINLAIRCGCEFSGRDLELLGTALERCGTATPKRESRTENTISFSLDAVVSGYEVWTVVVV